MKYWWVNHKQTASQELGGGYIWSPKKERHGAESQFYNNLPITRPYELIFSFANGCIGAVGTISSGCTSSPRPIDFGIKGAAWNSDGWLVPVVWRSLSTPVKITAHIAAIRHFLPGKYSPIQINGNGNQKCYLAEIQAPLASALLRIISECNDLSTSMTLILHELEDEAEEEKLLRSSVDETTRSQLVMARRGQGLFRNNVIRTVFNCQITGSDWMELLVASHIKPWRSSNNYERLDGENGLLLAPHVDKLFDSGLISFDDGGIILSASDRVLSVLKEWGISPKAKIDVPSEARSTYLDYHRQHIFQGTLRDA